jgi:polyvinyl alcohol dehydrogenase (cytochrome)
VQPVRPGPQDWPTYGHDAQRTFHGVTTLKPTDAPTLLRAWFFPTDDAVTANPIAVQDTVYVGSWDGNFYAINRATGQLRWKFAIKRQNAVSPVPGQSRDITSDGGLITSSAWFEPAAGHRPNLVIFGGGYTLYALNAATGAVFWSHDYPGLPEKPADPDRDEARIFSSPAVVGNRVLFGVSSDGQNHHRGYVVGADLDTGQAAWKFETDVDPKTGVPRNDGCGGVWSSPSILPTSGLMVFDVGDCDFVDTPPYDEAVLALHIADGKPAWVFHPPRPDPHCDWDFGASANTGIDATGAPAFLGVGGKDGTYYSLDPTKGTMRWQRNVVFGGFAGGFIGTTAFDGNRVYGATALGDFGRFEGFGAAGCQLGNVRDLPLQEPSLHAIDASTGRVVWQQPLSQSFGPTTTAGGMVFMATGITPLVKIHDANTGLLLGALPLIGESDSGVVVAGNALFVGTGSSELGALAGVTAFTPLGVAPTWAWPTSVRSFARADAPPSPAAPQPVLPVTGDPAGRLPIGAALLLLALAVSSRSGLRAGWPSSSSVPSLAGRPSRTAARRPG